MHTVVLVLHILFSIGIIAGVLLQSGRSAGLSGAIAGGATTLFGKKKGLDDILARITTGFAIAFMLSSIALTLIR